MTTGSLWMPHDHVRNVLAVGARHPSARAARRGTRRPPGHAGHGVPVRIREGAV
jgi:hypothetical protein